MVSVGYFLARVRITWHIEAVPVKTDVTQVFLRLLLSKSVSAPWHMAINPPHTLPAGRRAALEYTLRTLLLNCLRADWINI